MRFMNDYDIAQVRSRFTRSSTPNRLGLVLVIDALREWTDTHSDGWTYWPKPCRAAASAIALVDGGTWEEQREQEENDLTDAEVAQALRPIKAFLTRQAREVDSRNGRQRCTPEDRERILRGAQPLFEVVGVATYDAATDSLS